VYPSGVGRWNDHFSPFWAYLGAGFAGHPQNPPEVFEPKHDARTRLKEADMQRVGGVSPEQLGGSRKPRRATSDQASERDPAHQDHNHEDCGWLAECEPV
jgi:hypothetical protein